MSDNNTLLGHLVPKLPMSTENAAVEALAFILNDSEAAMAAFNALIGEGCWRTDCSDRQSGLTGYC